MPASHSASGPRPAETTILVVDDDPVILTLVERSLRTEGYRVWTATRAEEARKLLAELAGAVDLVLTDIAMPGGLGEHLLKNGVDVPETRLLNKPFMPAQLVNRVREALSA